MPREISAICTAVRAFIAGKWALARMCTLVCGKKMTSLKSIPAFIAGERALAGMIALLQHEIAALSTSKITFVKRERAREICTLMRSQTGYFCIPVVAFIARESILNFRRRPSGVSALVCLEIVAS